MSATFINPNRVRRITTPVIVPRFDEIEKAHRDVFNIFLQILDDGHATDSKGRKVNFKNTLIIFTSNLLADEFEQEALPSEKILREKLVQFFRPEFLNRLDDMIPFHALRKIDIEAILELQLSAVIKKLKKNQNIDLSVSDKAKSYLAETGFDPAFGARPLKRAIERELLNPLALKILESGNKKTSTIQVDMKNGALEFIY